VVKGPPVAAQARGGSATLGEAAAAPRRSEWFLGATRQLGGVHIPRRRPLSLQVTCNYELYREERAVSPLRSPKTEKKRKKSAKKAPRIEPSTLSKVPELTFHSSKSDIYAVRPHVSLFLSNGFSVIQQSCTDIIDFHLKHHVHLM